MSEKMREEFEAAYAKRAGCDIDALRAARWGDNGYRDPFAAAHWFGWIDSRAALVVELPRRGYWGGYDQECFMEAKEVEEALTDAGVRWK